MLTTIYIAQTAGKGPRRPSENCDRSEDGENKWLIELVSVKAVYKQRVVGLG